VGRLHIPLAFTRDRVHVLLSLDTEKTDLTGLGPEIVKGGDYPQAWTRSFGSGRVFYTALGHRDDIWSSDPVFRAHVLGGIRWSLRLEE
jgi:type 1 glutamine amidotransferase